MEKRDIIKISSKYFKALENFETAIQKNNQENMISTYKTLDEVNEILNGLSENELKSVMHEVKHEISKKPGALQTLENMKEVFPTFVPLVVGLGEDFTNNIIDNIDTPDNINSTPVIEDTQNTSLTIDVFVSNFSSFLNKLRQDVRLEFIAFLNAFIKSGDYAIYVSQLAKLSKIEQLQFIINQINNKNGFSNNLISFENNQIKMKTMGSGLTDVIYLSEDNKIVAIDATSSFGSEIEGNQFLRHSIMIDRCEKEFLNSSSKSIQDLRRIINQVFYQTKQQTPGNPYSEFGDTSDKSEYFKNMSSNYSVIQSSHYTNRTDTVKDKNTTIKAMNIMTFLGYFSNIKGNSVGLEDDEDIELFLSQINIQFIGSSLDKDAEFKFNSQLTDIQSIKKIRKYMAEQILNFLTGNEGQNNFIKDIFNTKDIYISLIKYIEYMQESEFEDSEPFEDLTIEQIARLEDSIVYKNNQADHNMYNIINRIKKNSKQFNRLRIKSNKQIQKKENLATAGNAKK